MLTDGNIKVTFVPTIADPSAPTVAELTAGTDLECLITSDGLDLQVKEDTVSIPKLCDTVNSEAPGRATYTANLTMVRKTVALEDVAWTTCVRGTQGYLVLRYGTAVATDYTASDKVIVFKGAFGERQLQKPAANDAVKFISTFYVDGTPQIDVAITAGA